MRVQWLERSLFLAPYYTLCTTEKQFRAELRKLKAPTADTTSFLASKTANATTHFLTNEDGKTLAIVTLPIEAHNTRTPIEIAGLLVHEAVHIWQEAAEMVGEHEPSAELEAYGVQTISQHLMWDWVRQTTGVTSGA